jgi:hypothetical protein
MPYPVAFTKVKSSAALSAWAGTTCAMRPKTRAIKDNERVREVFIGYFLVDFDCVALVLTLKK